MNQQKRRVVVTGIGVISPNGIGKENFWNALKSGKSGVGKITRFDASQYNTKIAGEVKDFDADKYIGHKKARRLARFAQFALAGAKMSLQDAQLEIVNEDPGRVSVVIGMATQAVDVVEEINDAIREKGPQFVNPFSAAKYSPNAAVVHICVEFGIKGKSMIITTGCSSASNAIGYSFEAIKSGDDDLIITGGVETPVSPTFLGSFCAMKSLSMRNEEPEKASRPFDKNRDGYVLSEASAILILEELEHALKRNANIYAEVIGYACTSDCYSMYEVNPSEEQAVKAMVKALKNTNIKPKDMNYISAHGSSSPVSDARETRAIKGVFDGYSKKIPISSIKSMIGHPLGAAGAIQSVACIMAMQENVIHPTINYDDPDPACDLDYVPNEARYHKVDVALINSLGIGGNNATLILQRYN